METISQTLDTIFKVIKKFWRKNDLGQGDVMRSVHIEISEYSIDYDQAKQIAELLALRDNEFATLVVWSDRTKGVHSPQCLKCEIKGEPGWEVYGRNHEGRLRISFNDDAFVFIYR